MGLLATPHLHDKQRFLGGGRVPFDSRGARDAEPPPPPRSLVPAVPRDLEVVCLKCLERDPGARYGSLAELADDLQRTLRGEPPKAGPPNFAARAWRFTRRHRFAVATSAAAFSLLVIIAVGAVLVAQAQKRSALRANEFAAEALTGEVKSSLQAQVNAVLQLTSSPEITARLGSEHGVALAWLRHVREQGKFEHLWAFDTQGRLLVQTDDPNGLLRDIGKGYEWRDYFQGARRLAKRGARDLAYISRAVQSEVDDQFKFGIAAPYYDAEGTWRGVVVANTATSSDVFGAARVVGHDGVHADAAGLDTIAVLVALQDRSRYHSEPKDKYVVIAHPGLTRPGEGHRIDAPALQELRNTRVGDEPDGDQSHKEQLAWKGLGAHPTLTSDDYHDPLPGWGGDRWLAAFAPVAQTGFVVIVQTRYHTSVTIGLLYPLIGVLGAIVLAWAAVFLSTVWSAARRGRGARPTPSRAGGASWSAPATSQ